MDLNVLSEAVSILTSVLTPFVIVIAIWLAFRFFRQYERNQMHSFELQRANLPRSGPSITISSEQAAPNGFDFIQVDDRYKPIFLDAMNGFADYAKLKGYTVELSTDTSHSGKVGIRFTIVDVGVTVSTATVRKDVDEYIRKFKDGADLRDMPMPESSIEHLHLISAIEARFGYVKTQLEMHQVKNDFLTDLLAEVKRSGLTGIAYAPQPQMQTLQLTVQNEGGKNMGDSYRADNSQNIAQGKGASANTVNSAVQIGNNHNERHERIEALRDFAQAVRTSDLSETEKADVQRYITNASDELDHEKEPNPDQVEKWLKRAESTVATATAGAGLVEKLLPILAMFGLS